MIIDGALLLIQYPADQEEPEGDANVEATPTPCKGTESTTGEYSKESLATPILRYKCGYCLVPSCHRVLGCMEHLITIEQFFGITHHDPEFEVSDQIADKINNTILSLCGVNTPVLKSQARRYREVTASLIVAMRVGVI